MANYMTEFSPDNDSHVYQVKDSEATPISLLDDTVGWTGKNKLKLTLSRLKAMNTEGSWNGNVYTYHGLTFTCNTDTDGNITSIVINGTATEIAYFDLDTNFDTSAYVGCLFNGIPSGTIGTSTYCVRICTSTSNRSAVQDIYTSSDTAIANNGTGKALSIRINGDYSCSNLTFYPMLRSASILDSTFEPYHDSVDYVKANRDEVKDVVGWSGKNKFDNHQDFFVGFIDATNNKFVLQTNYYMGIVPVKPNTKYIVTKQAGKTFRIALSTDKPANNVSFRYTEANHTGTEITITTGANDNYLSVLFWSQNNGDTGTYQQMADTVMVKKASIVDDTYEPYHKSVKDTLRDAEVIEGKNVLEIGNDIVTKEINGITWTINRNAAGQVESINANGTASADSTYHIGFLTPKYFDFRLNGCKGGSSSTYCIMMQDVPNATVTLKEYDGEDITLPTISSDKRYRISLVVFSGKTVSNVKFYPMVRSKKENNTFEPYYRTTEQKLRDYELVQGKNKNVYPYIISSQSNNGVTLTVDDKGIININGTATAANTCVIHNRAGLTDDNPIILPAGNYAVTKNVTGGATVELVKTVNGSRTTIVMMGTGDVKKTFSLSETTQVGIVLGWENSTVFSNKKLGIMIVNESEDDLSFEPYYIPLKDSKMPWAYNPYAGVKNFIDGYSSKSLKPNTNLEKTSNGYRVYMSDSMTWGQAIFFYNNLPKNTDFIISCVVATTTGNAAISITGNSSASTTGQTSIKNIYTQNGAVSEKINTGNYDWIIIILQASNGTASQGNVTYSELMLRDARDTDSTYQPTAMTNRELTENVVAGSFVPTLESGYSYNTNSPCQCYKVGDIKILNMSVDGVSANQSTWTDIATIPDGYRPKNRIKGYARINGLTHCVDCDIYANGKIQVRDNTGNIPTSNGLVILATYV